MALVTYPLNGHEYLAEDAEAYFATRTSGVFSADNNFTATVRNVREIVIGPGLAWINNKPLAGKSVCNTSDYIVTPDAADASLPRKDRIVIRYDLAENDSVIAIKKGEPAAEPEPPEVVQTQLVYELGLYVVDIPAGSVNIRDADITSTMLDESVCGIMRDNVTDIPSSDLNKLASDLLKRLDTNINKYWDEKSGQIDELEEKTTSDIKAYIKDNTKKIDTLVEETAAGIEKYVEDSKAAFDGWFDGVRGRLDTDPAGGLYNMLYGHMQDTDNPHNMRGAIREEMAYTIPAVPAQSGTLMYTGEAQSPQWLYNEWGRLEIVGDESTTSAADVGEYAVMFRPKAGYRWWDGTTDAKTASWSIGKAALVYPSQSGTLTYTGGSLSPTWNNYDSAKLTLSGTTSATTAGTYNATFTPKSNYSWLDGTSGAKSVQWTIGKAPGSMSVDKTSLTLGGGASDTITVTRAGNGTVSATSSNTALATVSVSGTTVTVTSVDGAEGDCTVTIRTAAGTNYAAPESIAVSVEVTSRHADPVLENNTWEKIKEIADAGEGVDYWSVGDTKSVPLAGGGTVQAFILGFNHNPAREGRHNIHFMLGKKDGVPVCFCDYYYPDVPSGFGGPFYVMSEPDGRNDGGWGNSQMRTAVLGNASVPASPLSTSFMVLLPDELRAIMKPVTKYTDNTGGEITAESNVTATQDYLFLPSEIEVFGIDARSNPYEKNYQQQYQYFAFGNSRVFHNFYDLNTAAAWWLRSVVKWDEYRYCAVLDDGTAITFNGERSLGICPCFAA